MFQIMYTHVYKKEIDLIMVPEPNKSIASKAGWIINQRGDVRIYVKNRNVEMISVHHNVGCVIELKRIAFACGHISPNIKLRQLKDEVNKMMNTVSQLKKYYILL